MDAETAFKQAEKTGFIRYSFSPNNRTLVIVDGAHTSMGIIQVEPDKVKMIDLDEYDQMEPLPTVKPPKPDYTNGVKGFITVEQIRMVSKDASANAKNNETYIAFYVPEGSSNLSFCGAYRLDTDKWKYTQVYQAKDFRGNFEGKCLVTVLNMDIVDHLLSFWRGCGETGTIEISLGNEYPVQFNLKGNTYLAAPYSVESNSPQVYEQIVEYFKATPSLEETFGDAEEML